MMTAQCNSEVPTELKPALVLHSTQRTRQSIGAFKAFMEDVLKVW